MTRFQFTGTGSELHRNRKLLQFKHIIFMQTELIAGDNFERGLELLKFDNADHC